MGYRNRDGKNGYVYIMSNYKRNVLYIGVTSDLEERVWLHKQGKGSKFSKKYKTTLLVYFEEYPNIVDAIHREKQLKNWHRDWKMNLIRKMNPTFRDLFDTEHY